MDQKTTSPRKTTPSADSLPVIDFAPLRQGDVDSVAQDVASACRSHGFFYITGHGLDPSLEVRLDAAARSFFALPTAEKEAIAMARGGRAWRGYFPVGSELTSDIPDQKEGLYFGEELQDSDPRVIRGLPLHGRNQFPARPESLRPAVIEYMEALETIGQQVLSAIAVSLGLPPGWFITHLTAEPLLLFRIFRYPPLDTGETPQPTWSVGEHTDYGLLTLLKQDDCGGLQIRAGASWIPAPPIAGTLVCNIGDMLDKMTCGLYRSTPHRVVNHSGRDRLSFPFFLDPGFDREVGPIHPTGTRSLRDDWQERWDRTSVHSFRGTYGEYLQSKVARVFPELWNDLRP